MKGIATLWLALFLAISTQAQQSEFMVYPNGLIYPDETMAKLSRIVDSLNLKHKTCNANPVFFSKSQGVGHYVKLEAGNFQEALKDMQEQLPLDRFLKKYPMARVERDMLIIRSKYWDFMHREVVRFQMLGINNDNGANIFSNAEADYRADMKNRWIWSHNEKTSYSSESVYAFYFPSGMVSQPLPPKYARMVGYADCLIDTTTAKFKAKTEDGWMRLPDNLNTLSEEQKKALLDSMRGTRVVGACSMDSRPRTHAANIAILSAEINYWEVFLKAHLDIMNDRFDRVVDASYAWAGRKTYIKELEELNIQVSDLIMGTVFRIGNPVQNHYYADVSRVGRALAEAGNRDSLELLMLSIIADPELDAYNRLIFYFLFSNYNYYLTDEKRQAENTEKLAQAKATLPDYVRKRLVEKKK